MKKSFLKKIILIAVYGLPFVLGIFFLINLIFPKQVYLYQKEKLEESSLVIDQKNSFFLAPLADFGVINLMLETEEKTEKEETVILKKGFAATFYPISKEPVPALKIKKDRDNFYLVSEKEKQLIPTENILKSYTKNKETIPLMTAEERQKLTLALKPAGFREGVLISDEKQIFLISNGMKILFPSPLILEYLGYSWEKIIPATKEELRLHSSVNTVLYPILFHPDGTIIQQKGTQNYFLVQNGTLIPINEQERGINYETVTALTLPFNQEERVCHPVSGRCQFKLDHDFKNNDGGDYYFTLSSGMKIKSIRVEFSRSFNFLNFKKFLSPLKN
jgi:hypothetical protein